MIPTSEAPPCVILRSEAPPCVILRSEATKDLLLLARNNSRSFASLRMTEGGRRMPGEIIIAALGSRQFPPAHPFQR